MANYPTADPSFTTKNAGQTIQPSHINDAQDEIVAIGSGLRGTLQHGVTLAADKSLNVGGNSTFSGSVVCSSVVTAPAQPRAMVYSTAALALAADVFTAVSFESEGYDVGGLHSTASNPTRLTVPTGSSGLYLCGALVRLSTGAPSVQVSGRFLKNSTTEVGTAAAAPLSSQTGIALGWQQPVPLDAGDYVEVQLFPIGSTASLAAGTVRRNSHEFWAVKVW